MEKKIAILRGINVGGKRKILMSDLRLTCEQLGLDHVETYIQSGNVLFHSKEENPVLESRLEKAIGERFGFEVPVIIRNANALEKTIKNNPYFNSDHDINSLHLTFLKNKPLEIIETDSGKDEFEIHGKEIFILCLDKYHKSKLSNTFFEKQLKVGATTRNWKTVLKLIELSKSK